MYINCVTKKVNKYVFNNNIITIIINNISNICFVFLQIFLKSFYIRKYIIYTKGKNYYIRI